jgi:hypothetical protein
MARDTAAAGALLAPAPRRDRRLRAAAKME